MYMRTKVLIISVLIQMFSSLLTFAQVKFRFSDGIYDQALKKQVENNVSALLTEINRADSSNRTLNLAKIKMSKEASERLSMLWRYQNRYSHAKGRVSWYCHGTCEKGSNAPCRCGMRPQ